MANEWDEAYERTRKLESLCKVLIDGQAIDPYTIAIDCALNGDRRIEIVISTEILTHELEEAQIDLKGKSLAQSTADDLSKAELEVWKFYLRLAGAHPFRATRNIFGFYHGKRVPEKPKEWLWTGVTTVAEKGEVIVIHGTCRKC